MIRTVAVAYGDAALNRLEALVRDAKHGDPLAPATVVVSTNLVGVSVRRALAVRSPRGVAAVNVLTLHRLAELIGSENVVQKRSPVSNPVLASAVRQVLRSEPGMFAPVADHPATELALVAIHRELADLDDEQLGVLARQSVRAGEVVRVHRRVDDRLASGFFDESDLCDAAVEAVPDSPERSRLGPVIVHLPTSMTHAGARVLQALEAAGHPVTILFGRTGHEEADAVTDRVAERIGVEVPVAEPIEVPVADAIISATDPDEEVRAAARVVAAVLRQGVPAHRIGLFYAAEEPYSRLVSEHLEAAGVPVTGPAVRTLAGSLAGRTLLLALAVADHDYRRDEVMALLTSAPVLDPDGRSVPAAAWDRISRDAGVFGGADWTPRLARVEAALRERAGLSERDERAWERTERQADRASELVEFMAHLRGLLSTDGVDQTWSGRAAHARSVLDSLLGGQRRRLIWPEAEQAAADRVERILDRLGGLDHLESTVDDEVFRRTLEEELESALRRSGRIGEGVVTGPIGSAVGVDFEHVVVVGLVEGTFPGRDLDDSLVPDREREALRGRMRLRADRVSLQHHDLLATLAGAAPRPPGPLDSGDSATAAVALGSRTLCLARGDLRSNSPRVPSRWALDCASALAGERIWGEELERTRAPWLFTLASFAGEVHTMVWPLNDHERRLALLADHDRSGEPLRDSAVVAADPGLSRAIDCALARRSGDFTRFDGNLDGLVLPQPGLDSPISPTRLETWVQCPHKYLMRTVLGVEPVEAPEDSLAITALDRGSLIHEVLELFLQANIEAGSLPGHDQPWSEDHREQLRQVLAEVAHRYEVQGLTGRDLMWRRALTSIETLLELALDDDDRARAEGGWAPLAAEQVFGFGEGPEVVLDLGDGRTVRFRGSADRIDRRPDGGLLIIDYKSGSEVPYKGLSAENPIGVGDRLQLPIYGLAARALHGSDEVEVTAQYWFVRPKTRKRIGYEITEDVLEQVRVALTAVLEGIAAGVFPQRPPEPSFAPFVECEYCDPDGLGTGDRHARWSRKRHAPELRAYVGMVEPDG